MSITFNDLLQMPVEIVKSGLDYRMFHYWGIFNDEYEYRYDSERMQQENRVITSYIKSFSFDGHRTWELGYVTFDNQPVMIFYAYGRAGCDGYGKAILNKSLFMALEDYIMSLSNLEDYEVDTEYSLEDDAEWITSFYGQSLFDEFKNVYNT